MGPPTDQANRPIRSPQLRDRVALEIGNGAPAPPEKHDPKGAESGQTEEVIKKPS